jgi:DnaA family protein
VTDQLPLALTLRHAPRLEDFIVGDNAVVLAAIRQLLSVGTEHLVFLSGPSGSGRTHLLSGLCAAGTDHGLRCAYLPLRERDDLAPELLEGLERLDLVAVDDVMLAAGAPEWEHALFHLFNRCREAGTRLLFSADRGPAALPLALPDLRTRLAWGLTLALAPLDDEGRERLLQDLARRRGLELPGEVSRYMLDRAPRHPKELVALIDRLDHASLAKQRRLTVPFVRDHMSAG